jgi:iron complex outermembrane receptor protein
VEAGIHYKTAGDAISFSGSLTAYSRIIDDWIMWMPPVKGVRDYWAPINIAKVKSEGLETRATLTWPAGDWKFDFDAGLDLTWSTFQESLPDLKIEAGEQLFYVPVENGMAGVVAHFHQFSMYYRHHWFGPSTGINDDIDAVSIGSTGASMDITLGTLKSSIYIQVDNVWDVPYRIIERRPMPGRSFLAGLKFTL